MKVKVLFVGEVEIEGDTIKDIAKKFDYLKLFTNEAEEKNYASIVDIEEVWDIDKEESIMGEFHNAEYE